MDIVSANAAKRKLLELNLDVIKSACLVLGNDGFRIEIVWDRRMKWLPPTEFMGFRVVATSS